MYQQGLKIEPFDWVTRNIRDIDMADVAAARNGEASRCSDVSAAETPFDYQRSAELFPTRSRKPRRNPMTYKRFDTAAAAVRFAIEELPSDFLLGAYLQVDEDRFGSQGIRRLYDSIHYPLKRRVPSQR
jgi:hypothetical protein